MSRLIAAGLCALVVATCPAAELRAVEAPRAATPIAVDGALADPAWEQAAWNTGFTVLNLPEQQATNQSRFKVLHDDANLYFGIELDEPTPDKLRMNALERDSKIFADDCVEVMVDPTGDRVEYYHFAITPRGAIYDSQVRQGGNVMTAAWNCDLEAAAQVGERAWCVELRIPIVELDLGAASTGDWAVNVTRERRAEGEELTSFVPTTGGFHQPSLYAVLKLKDADLGQYLWEIKRPYEVSILPGEDGKLVYRAKTHLKNAGPKFRFIMLRGVLGDSAGPWVKDGLDADQDREYEFQVPVAEQGAQTLRLELVDRREPETTLAIRSLQANITYTPISITMIRPWYRDCIYATEKLDEIVFDVAIAVPEEELAKLTLTVELAPEAADAKPIAATTQPAQPTATVKLPLKTQLSEGAYRLNVALLAKTESQPRYAVRRTIRKLPRVAHEWRIDERNILLHNGEPVLPFGWFSIPAEKMDDPGHAYQLCQSYNSQYYSVQVAREKLDAYVAAGTAAAIYPYPTNRMMSPASVWGQPFSDEDAEALRLRIRALKDHPGVFAWYMADEPELRPALPERCRRIYEVVSKEDPFHPCIMLNDTIAGIYKYPEGGDVLMPDPYPLFLKGGHAARPLDKTGQFIKACGEAGKGRKAIWVTPQAFNYGDVGRKNNRAPNLTELRNQWYQAVVYGAKGALWYTYGHVSNYPDLDLGMRWLSFETADLKDAILADPAEGVEVKVEAPQPEHLHISVRRVDNELYLFAVNTATEPQDVKLTLAPVSQVKSWYVVSEGRTVTLREGATIEDRFETYATHIYTTNEEVGGRENIATAQAEIAKADAARKKPGNLAFEENGTTVEVSSKSRYGSTPSRVLDGIETGMRWRDGTANKLPDWLIVRWPEPVKIGRVVVYAPSLSDFEIQVPEGDDWVKVGEAAGNTEERVEVALAELTETDAIRVFITKLMPEQKYSAIWEVEAYAR